MAKTEKQENELYKTVGYLDSALKKSGVLIDFEIPQTYGVDTPETGNIIVDVTKDNKHTGFVLVKHNSGSAPTITMSGGTCYRVSTTDYVTGQINYIYLMWLKDDEVIYTISQRQ